MTDLNCYKKYFTFAYKKLKINSWYFENAHSLFNKFISIRFPGLFITDVNRWESENIRKTARHFLPVQAGQCWPTKAVIYKHKDFCCLFLFQ